MKKILSLFTLFASLIAFSQAGIGTTDPHVSAILDLTTTNKALLIPRVANTAAIASPVNGMIIYDITANCMKGYADGAWTTCFSDPTAAITTLDCASATQNGILQPAVAASNVTVAVNYTGGNGIAYFGQTITSTGVTGLTATLSTGTLATGTGTLTYSITGTPSTNGTASFALNIAGKSCVLNVLVSAISNLNCASATHNGSLVQNTAVPAGVTSVISYTGGNGSAHSGQTVNSTGVSGLTATLVAGNFANGNGTLSYTITGNPTGFGQASFAINIGGQTCTLTRWVAASTGQGTFSGKTCFDIAESNDNVNGCVLLTTRTPNRDNFNNVATYQQTYTFTPVGTVSNVRFFYVNNGAVQVITNLTGGDSSNNISTAKTATITYNPALSSPDPNNPNSAAALGLTSSNPLTADIYVVYNDGTSNNGVDRQLKLTANIKDCSCCGAFVEAGVYKEFLCHNLGADTLLDPHIPVVGLQGAYIQWGKRGPSPTNNPANILGLTGDSRIDWQTYPNAGTIGFAAAPTASDANVAVISNWSQTIAPNYAWRTASGAKTANDPCPAGYRVPTWLEWVGVNSYNIKSITRTWTTGNTEYDSSLHYGPNNSTKLLSLPAAGGHLSTNGTGFERGLWGHYWSSTEAWTEEAYSFGNVSTGANTSIIQTRLHARSVRCIAE